MEINGRIGTYEGERLRSSIVRRVLGKWRAIGIAIVVVVGLLVGLALSPISRALGSTSTASNWFIAGFVVAAISGFAAFGFAANRLRKGWYARGMPAEIDVSYCVTPDGFVMTTKLSSIVARWPFISEVALAKDSWLILGAGIAYFLPRRLFASPAEEQAFISALMKHLSPEARARSKVLLK